MRNPEHVIDRQRRQIAQLREQVEELTETVRQLRKGDLYAHLPRWVPHLSPIEETMLITFRDSRLSIISNEAMFSALYSHLPENQVPDIKVVDTHLCHLRKKLAGTGVEIVTKHWVGHYLSKASKDLLNGVNLPVMNGVHAGASIQ